MSCPYFEIQKTADFEHIAEIIDSDKESKHFLRQRRYTPFEISDDNIKTAFDRKISHSQSVYFNALRFFSIIFPVMIAISIYVMIAAAPEEKWGLSVIPITTLFIGIGWVIFLILHTTEFSFAKSVDELFVLYDKANKPCCIEIGKERIRILYDGMLHVIKNEKIKTIRNDRKLYYAYLNMFPQSIFDMGKYVDNTDKYLNAVLIPYVNYMPSGGCTLSFGARVPFQTENAPVNSAESGKTYTLYPLLRSLHVWRHLHFCKFIFTVNNESKLTSIYSAARENAVIDHSVLTLSTVAEIGDAAIEALKQTASKNSLLINQLYKLGIK